MRKVLLVAGIIFCWMSFVSAQTGMTITENFDGNITWTISPTSAWKIDTNYYISPHNSIRGIVPNMRGDSIVLTTGIYDFRNYPNVQLRFNHICKVSPQDITRIEYRIGGQAWKPISASAYDGKATNYSTTGFNANSYSEWKSDDSLALPSQSWWNEEVFDLGFETGMASGVQFRFILKHGNTIGTQISYGWLLEDIKIILAPYEIQLPVAEFIPPLVKGTVYGTGPWDINAKVKSQTIAQIEPPRLVYKAVYNGVSVGSDTVLMTMIAGDSLWRASIPQFEFGTEVIYSISARTMGGSDTVNIVSGYTVTKPIHNYGDTSCSITIISPIEGQVLGDTLTPVEVMLHNRGDSVLTSATIHWSVNGVQQTPPYNWTGNLLWDFEEAVSLGTYSPQKEGYDTIVVWVTNPNGIQDVVTSDDTVSVTTFGCISSTSASYNIGVGEKFQTVTEALDLFKMCYPNSDVTLALKNDVYTENWNLSDINNFMGNHTLTITSLTNNKNNVILRPTSGVGITLSNSDNVRIENITIDATLTTTHAIQFTGACSNVVVDNCIILSDTTSSSSSRSCIYKNTNTGALVNMTVTNCSITGGYHGIHLYGTGSMYCQNITIENNIISKQYYYGIYLYYADLNSVSHNSVTPRTTSQSTWFGIYFLYTRNGNIIGNSVIANNPGITSDIIGLRTTYIDSALVANNEIYLNSSANTTYGMYLYYSNVVDYLHNSVLMTGTGGATFRAAQIYVSTATYNLSTYKNNIFIANGGTTPYAVYLSAAPGATFAQYNDIDYNNYYSSGNLGYAGVAIPNLTTWKATVPTDNNSVNILPKFADLTKGLELSEYTSLHCNLLPAVSSDIRDMIRIRSTAMGCYEEPVKNVNGVLTKIVGIRQGTISVGDTDSIKIVFINEGNTPLTSVNLRWTVNEGTQSQKECIFSKPLSRLESDTVYLSTLTYPANNVNLKVWINSFNNGVLSDQFPGNDTVSAFAFVCSSTLSGNIPVGGSNTFTSVSAALNAISLCKGGDIVLVLESGVYEENWNLSNLNDFIGNNTLKITSKTGNQNDVILRIPSGVGVLLNNSNNVTLENITIDATKGNYGIQFTGSCSNIVINKCTILIDTTLTTNTYVAIDKKANTGSLNDLTIKNCTIQGGYYGIYLFGIASDYCQNVIIDSNIITKQYNYGIYTSYLNFKSISYNQVSSRIVNWSTWWGISIAYSTHGVIVANKIRTNVSGSSSSLTPILIGLDIDNVDSALVYNNEIYLNSLAYMVYGLSTNRSNSVDYLHNSVLIAGAGGMFGGTYVGAMIVLDDMPSRYENNMFVSHGTSDVESYAIYLSGNPPANFAQKYQIDNNNYSSTYNLGYFQSDKSDFTTWKAATGIDLHSTNFRPAFIDSSLNLQLSNNNSFLCLKEPSVNVDINDVPRTGITTKGCYHGTIPSVNATLRDISGYSIGVSLGKTDTIKVSFINMGTTPLTNATLKWTWNNNPQQDYVWTGSLASGSSILIPLGTITHTQTGAYTIKAWLDNLGGLTDQSSIEDTVFISEYICDSTYIGTYTVGTGGDFTTIADALNKMEICGVKGDITLKLLQGRHSEEVKLIDISSYMGNYTLTLTSNTANASDAIIEPTSTGVELSNSSNIVIKNLTIDGRKSIKYTINFTSACTNIVIRDCIILSDTTSLATMPAGIGKLPAGTTRSMNISIINNIIEGGEYGLYFYGPSSSIYDTCIIVDSNTIRNQNKTASQTRGINIQYAHLTSCSNNTIIGTATSTTASWYGIYLYYVNGYVTGNRVHQQTAIRTPYGISIQYFNYYNTTDTGLIANNEIIMNATNTEISGILVNIYSKAKIVHNSIYVTGTNTTSTSIYTRGINIVYNAYNYVVVRNNNIVMKHVRAYPIYINSTTNLATLYDIGCNNMYAPTYVGYIAGAKANMTAWQVNLPLDIASTNVLPVFKDETSSLELSDYTGLSCPVYPQVMKDIEDNFRVGITTMGAYNGLRVALDLEVQKIICQETEIVYPHKVPINIELINNGGHINIDSATFGWSINGELQPPYTYIWSPKFESGDSLDIALGSFDAGKTSVFDISVWVESVNGRKDSIPMNDTVRATFDIFNMGTNLSVQSIEKLFPAEQLCIDDYTPLKTVLANTGTSDYIFAAKPVNLHVRVTTPYSYSLDTLLSTGVLASGETMTITLTDTFSTVTAGIYDIKVWMDSINYVIYDDTVSVNYLSGKFGLPVDEDFSQGIPLDFRVEGLNSPYTWEVVSKGTGADTVVVPQFGTGMIAFRGSPGTMATLSTQQLDLSRTVKPSLSFWYFHDTVPCEDYTDVQITINGGATYESFLLLTKYDATYGWKQYNVELPSYAVNQCVILVFEAMEKSRSEDITQYIDRIIITAERDIAITDILIPEYDVCHLENKDLKIVLTNKADPVLDYADTLIVTLEVQETGQTFTKTLTNGFLPSFASDTVTIATGFNFEKGTYTFKAYFSSILDVNRNNDTLKTSIIINPKLEVQLSQVSGNNTCLFGETPIWQEVILINTGNMALFDIDLIFQIDTGQGAPACTIKASYADTIHINDTITYSLDSAYMVPWNIYYYPRIYASLSCDSAMVNATTSITECVDMEDLHIISIDNPSTGNDTVGASIQVKATLQNRSDISTLSNRKITLVVANSQRIEIARFEETIAQIGILATINYTFTNTYTVPNDSVYYLTVYIDHNDNYLSNDTIEIERITEKDSQDLSIAIAYPSTGKDLIGSVIQASVSVSNNSKYNSFDNGVDITVLVTNSQGVQTAKFIETTVAIGTLSTINHTFTQIYTVPNDSVYYLTVYIESYDEYSYNDTAKIRRETNNVGIRSAGTTDVFTLSQNVPNPANNSTRIDYNIPESGEVMFHVHSISGQLLYSQSIDTKRGTNSIELNTSAFAAGVYFYSMEYKGQRLVRQLIIK